MPLVRHFVDTNCGITGAFTLIAKLQVKPDFVVTTVPFQCTFLSGRGRIRSARMCYLHLANTKRLKSTKSGI